MHFTRKKGTPSAKADLLLVPGKDTPFAPTGAGGFVRVALQCKDGNCQRVDGQRSLHDVNRKVRVSRLPFRRRAASLC